MFFNPLINSISYLDMRLDFQGHFGHLNVICIYLSSQDSLASISFLGIHNGEKVCLRLHSYYSFNTDKAELPQESILFFTQFPPLGIFINKKVGFLKN